MAVESNLTILMLTDTEVRIDVVDSAGAAQNMTGWALAFVVRPRALAGVGTPVTLSKTTGAGITIGNGTATGDRATIAIADTDLPSTLAPGNGYQGALWRTDAGSDVPLWYGMVTLQAVAQQSS